MDRVDWGCTSRVIPSQTIGNDPRAAIRLRLRAWCGNDGDRHFFWFQAQHDQYLTHAEKTSDCNQQLDGFRFAQLCVYRLLRAPLRYARHFNNGIG